MDEKGGTQQTDAQPQAAPPDRPFEPVRLTTFGPFPPPPDLPEAQEGGERPALTGERKAPASTGAATNGTPPAEARETAIALRVSERERGIIDALAKIRSDDGVITAPTVSEYIRWLIERDNRQVLEAITEARRV